MPDKKELEHVNKLTIKNLKVRPREVKDLPEGETRLVLAIIFGKASAVRFSEDANTGVAVPYFTGIFEGINMQDETALRSEKLMLPKGLSDMVERGFKELEKNDEKGSISFVFELLAEKANTQAGYQYQATILQKPEVSDELKEMRNFVAAHQAKNKGKKAA